MIYLHAKNEDVYRKRGFNNKVFTKTKALVIAFIYRYISNVFDAYKT